MDIDSSRHIHVNRVDIDTNDDCLSIKSGKDADGLRVNRPAEDILIENSHFGAGGSGVDMGSETSGGIRNVVIQNCVMDSNNSAPIRFKSAPSRGGLVENITYRNLVLHQTRQFVEMNLNWTNRAMARLPPAPPANPLPLLPQRQNHQRLRRRADGRYHQRPSRQPNPGRHLPELPHHRQHRPQDHPRPRHRPLRPHARRQGRPPHHQNRRAIDSTDS